MAIVDLGMQTLVTGALPVSYTPFPYNQRRAYALIARMTSPDFDLVYSYVRVSFLVIPDSDPNFLLADTKELEIIQADRMLFFAASRLYGSNGDVIISAQRLPRWRGAGDGRPMTLQFAYDDQLDVPSWLN